MRYVAELSKVYLVNVLLGIYSLSVATKKQGESPHTKYGEHLLLFAYLLVSVEVLVARFCWALWLGPLESKKAFQIG